MTWPGLGVVVVLYGTSAADSPALRGLAEHVREDDGIHVAVQDNSETPSSDQDLPTVVEDYVARPDNPGLSEAYQRAAELFSSAGIEWMALLDQDTTVTREYLDEVLDIVRGRVTVPSSVAVLVPKLEDSGRQVSPHGRVRLRSRSVPTSRGVVSGFSTHLNSGSVLRLEAVRRIGGLPEGYPLDYLDHALASRLRESGGLTWVLGATLRHRLSLLERRSLSAARLASILEAERRYHLEFGSRGDVAWLAARLWAGAVLSTTHLRPSPDAALERRAAVAATLALLTRTRRLPERKVADAGL
ncbi:hypothetical protein [Oryzobacter terrae]|uniref:hypothetical protein n=1 Tax=Oryzobacter terrae TaxID=1620385 RepID=UPI00366CE61E